MANSHRERSNSYRARRNLKKVKSVLFSISLCACAIIASVIYGLKDMVEDFGEATSTNFGDFTIALQATLLSVDPGVGSMTVNWEVIGFATTLGALDPSGTKGPSDITLADYPSVSIYFDENTLFQSDGSTKYFTNEIPALPIFQFTPALWETQYANSANFQTRINLFPKRKSKSLRSTSSLRIYPFDTYSSQMRLFAQNSATNRSLGLSVIGVVGIPGFSAQVADRPSEDHTIHETIIISRGNATKGYAIIFVLSVWAVTLIFLYSTSMSVICGYPHRVEFLGIPLATFFTVAEVRPTMPGSPEFGVLMDNVGLIPCLSVMATCSALNLSVLLMPDATKERASLGKTFNWILLGLYKIITGLLSHGCSLVHDFSLTQLTGFLCTAVPHFDLAIYSIRVVKNQDPDGRDLTCRTSQNTVNRTEPLSQATALYDQSCHQLFCQLFHQTTQLSKHSFLCSHTYVSVEPRLSIDSSTPHDDDAAIENSAEGAHTTTTPNDAGAESERHSGLETEKTKMAEAAVEEKEKPATPPDTGKARQPPLPPPRHSQPPVRSPEQRVLLESMGKLDTGKSPATAVPVYALDGTPYVGDATWEELTWKELTRLREDMFRARLSSTQ